MKFGFGLSLHLASEEVTSQLSSACVHTAESPATESWLAWNVQRLACSNGKRSHNRKVSEDNFYSTSNENELRQWQVRKCKEIVQICRRWTLWQEHYDTARLQSTSLFLHLELTLDSESQVSVISGHGEFTLKTFEPWITKQTTQ